MKKHIFYIIGLFLILLYNLPWILNGENASYRIYDLLEQDFVNIYLNAKYLFHPFVTEIPELFGGTFRGSIQAHSFLQIILYKFIQGVHFLNFNQIFMQFIGFSGMYILANKIYHTEDSKVKSFINMGCSFLFCITPLLLHGMTIMSMPLFAWMLIKIYESKTTKDLFIIYGLCLFLGISTSLIYCGFLYLIILFCLGIYFIHKKRKDLAVKYLTSMFIILAGYITTYFYSFLALGEVSHRLEWELPECDFYERFTYFYSRGIFNFEEPIFPYIPFLLFSIATFLILIKRRYEKFIEYKISMICFFAIVIIIFLTCAYSSFDLILRIRSLMGILQSFQLDRICYIVGPLWYFILISILLFLYNFIIDNPNKIKNILFYIAVVFVFATQFQFIINNDNNCFDFNIKALKKQQPAYRTYAQFFQTDLMNEIKDYIGKPQNSYHIVSFGINPGVPLFNGFYCLDGYSTNYRLEYKKKWEDIIKGELLRDEVHRNFFYFWGGRAYIVSHQFSDYTPSEMYDKKKYIDKLYIDYAKLKELGADYLFSKYEIKEPNPYIKLEKVFYSKIDNGDKDFQVFLYSIHDAK